MKRCRDCDSTGVRPYWNSGGTVSAYSCGCDWSERIAAMSDADHDASIKSAVRMWALENPRPEVRR